MLSRSLRLYVSIYIHYLSRLAKAFSSQLKPEDSDDENAPNLKRKRWDFETDMEWQAYEARRENRALAKEKGML